MHPIAFTTRQEADFLLLSGAFEVEGRAIGPAVDFCVTQLDHVQTIGNRFPNIGIGVEIIAGLIHIGQLYRVAKFNRALIGLFLAGEHLEQRGFTRAVGPNHAYNAAGREREGQTFNQ